MRYLARRWLRFLWTILGVVALFHVLEFSSFKSIDLNFEKQVLSRLYSTDRNYAQVTNLYIPQNPDIKNDQRELVKALRWASQQTDKDVFFLANSQLMGDCSSFVELGSNVILVLRDRGLDAECVSELKKQNIKILGFLNKKEIQNTLSSKDFFQSQDFAVTLKKGKTYRVENIASYFYKKFDKSPVDLKAKKFNFVQSMTSIPQIQFPKILSEDSQNLLQKPIEDKNIFVSVRSNTKPYSVDSQTINDAFYLSSIFHNLNSKLVLKKASTSFYKWLMLILYFQVFLCVFYAPPVSGVLFLSLVVAESLVGSIFAMTYYQVWLPVSGALISLGFSWVYFQVFKRIEIEQSLRATKAKYARRIINVDQLNDHFVQKQRHLQEVMDEQEQERFPSFSSVNNKTSKASDLFAPQSTQQDMTKFNTENSEDNQEEFNKYLTQIHMDIDKEALNETPNFQNSEKDNPELLKNLKKTEQNLDSAKQSLSSNNSVESIRPVSNVGSYFHPTSIKDPGSFEINKKLQKDTPIVPFRIDVKLGEKQKTNVEKKVNQQDSLVDNTCPVVKNFETEQNQAFAKQSVFLTKNLSEIFKTNRDKKGISFEVKNQTLSLDFSEIFEKETKARMFFEAICLQVVNDCKKASEIEFSSYQKEGFLLYYINYQSDSKFLYKNWLNNSSFFAKIAENLNLHGLRVYHQHLSSGQSDLVIAFKLKCLKQRKKAA